MQRQAQAPHRKSRCSWWRPVIGINSISWRLLGLPSTFTGWRKRTRAQSHRTWQTRTSPQSTRKRRRCCASQGAISVLLSPMSRDTGSCTLWLGNWCWPALTTCSELRTLHPAHSSTPLRDSCQTTRSAIAGLPSTCWLVKHLWLKGHQENQQMIQYENLRWMRYEFYNYAVRANSLSNWRTTLRRKIQFIRCISTCRNLCGITLRRVDAQSSR